MEETNQNESIPVAVPVAPTVAVQPAPATPRSSNHSCLLFFIILLAIIVGITMIILAGIFWFKTSVSDKLESNLNSGKPRFEQSYVTGNRQSDNKILIIPVNGIIIAGRSDSGWGNADGAAANQICPILNDAAEDSSIKAVILRIDSPGGEVVAADRIYRAVLNLRKSGKPVVAQMESLAASGGYYIAAGCDYIIANPMTTTGSIGVIMAAVKYYDLMQKIGVRTENYTSGKMKDMLSGGRPTTPEEQVLVQRHINAVYDQFVQIVAKGRPKLSVEKIKNSEIGDGRIFIGTEAQKLGLVDALGYAEEAELKAAELAKLADYQVISSRRRFSLMNMLLESRSEKALKLEVPGTGARLDLEAGKLYFLPNF